MGWLKRLLRKKKPQWVPEPPPLKEVFKPLAIGDRVQLRSGGHYLLPLDGSQVQFPGGVPMEVKSVNSDESLVVQVIPSPQHEEHRSRFGLSVPIGVPLVLPKELRSYLSKS